jgi:ribonuclease R
VPVSSLPDEFWMYDEATQTLNGRRTRLSFRLAEDVEVRLAEASPITGGLVYHIMQGDPNQGGRQQAGREQGGPGAPGAGRAAQRGASFTRTPASPGGRSKGRPRGR